MTPGRPGPRLARNSQPTPLVIRQTDPSITELFEKDAMLFPKEVNRGLLMTSDPACERREEDLPGLNGVGHVAIVTSRGLR